ncbi:GAP family protein [Nonomuraea rhodomycinica]|uniref:GAP family protein n=1 Tax=Nonomuraea rhodomycinica TaxID=1712872 RepID=A0A7Y6IVR9_9ACTN|nr:GAP family protein [Nonomuraea rhodomycinica]NUW44723.1 GAP family protein [Nonomuraea rhodomycinica]
MELAILPLAVTMMMGPQIVSAVILATTERPVRASLAFLAGVALAATIGVAILRALFLLLGGETLGRPADHGSLGTIIQIALVVLLAALAVKNYVTRASAEPPKWLGALMEAGPGKAFTTGFLLILLMPSDLMVMATVGVRLAQAGESLAAAVPFLAATVLIAALPLLALLIFHRRAKKVMPQVRTWANTNGWLINILACLIFIVLILA